MTPQFSVLVPTLNEASHLAATLDSVCRAFGADAEIIVSDGGSTDATAEIARRYDASIINNARGRGAQLNAALRAARGDVCILLHADTQLPANAKNHIAGVVKSSVGGAFLLRFLDDDLAWLAQAINLRSRIFRTATGDQAIFARREILLDNGGVPEIELFEDVRVWQKLKRAGRVTLLSEKVTTSARLWRRFGTWRIIFLHLRLRALHSLGVSPHRLARMYPTAGS